MKMMILTLLCLAGAGIGSADDFKPYDGPKPVAVLIQTDPWRMVIGSDIPLIAIYQDGRVVYTQLQEDGSRHYVSSVLSDSELKVVKDSMASFGDYSVCEGSYDLAPNVTDLPETRIYIDLDTAVFATKVYGLKIEGTRLLGYFVAPGASEPDELPDAINRLHQYLTQLKFSDSDSWVPDFYEVMIWPYEYAPDSSIHWPEDWPGLDSPYAYQWDNAYSIYLPGSEKEDLRAFLISRKKKGAVELDGKKWAISIRHVFPSEPIWQRAFAERR